MDTVSGALLRLHGPLTLRVIDRATLTLGLLLLVASMGLAALTRDLGGALCLWVGGIALLGHWVRERRWQEATIWWLAEAADDPIETLVLYEFLCCMPLRDVVMLARWRASREAVGLPIAYDDPMAPPQARRVFERLRACPQEQ